MYSHNSAEYKREMGKISLDTFTFDLHNSFDYSTDQLIKQMEDELSEVWRKLEEYKADLPNDIKEAHKEEEEFYGSSLDHEEYRFHTDIFYRKQELIAVVEMKIVYAYKIFETNMKRLLKAAYDDARPKDYYKWENFTSFLAVKKIEIQNLPYKTEVENLKNLNNAIKHTSDLLGDDKVRMISEFKEVTAIGYDVLLKFYNRVKMAPIGFLKGLSGAVYDDLYKFSNERLEALAHDYASRMNDTDAKRFCQLLFSHYQDLNEQEG